jgi:hypothetical protein
VLAVGPIAATTEVEDVDDEPPWGVLATGPVAATTEIGDVDGGPLWGDGGKSDSDHHRS